MAAKPIVAGDRTWFSDLRTPARRMAVSTHAEQGIVVISFWQADVCVATFRMPQDDSARLISALAYGMVRDDGPARGAVSKARTASSAAPPADPLTRLWRRLRSSVTRPAQPRRGGTIHPLR